GQDRGMGGTYLLMPPDFEGEAASGYIPVRSATYNGYALFQALPATRSEADTAKALALLKQLRLYPLSRADVPLPQRYLDISGKLFDGLVRFDKSYYDSLARMVDEEVALPRDAALLERLK